MLKRKPTTQYDREGVPIETKQEVEDLNISTPEEIKNRKIYRVKKLVPQQKSGFILKSKLVPDSLEAKLLQSSKDSLVNFLQVLEEEVKELSPEKAKTEVTPGPAQTLLSPKPLHPFGTPASEPKDLDTKKNEGVRSIQSLNPSIEETPANYKFINPLSSILNELKSKKEEELVNTFICSSPRKFEVVPTPSTFTGTPQKSILESLVSVEAQISVDHVSRGEGFVEIAKGIVSGRKVASFLFKNQIKTVIYQAGLTTSCNFKECKDWELGEDTENHLEAEIEVYKKINNITTKQTVRVLIAKKDQKALKENIEKIKSFLGSYN
jgi:hypothetical protein